MDLVTLYLPKNYYVTVSLLQYMILSLFNVHNSLTYTEALQLSGIKKELFDYNLRFLLSQNPAQSFLLKANHKTPMFELHEEMRLNLQFVSAQLKRSFVPSTKFKDITKDDKTDPNSPNKHLMTERALVIDAMIMKIMKVHFAMLTG